MLEAPDREPDIILKDLVRNDIILRIYLEEGIEEYIHPHQDLVVSEFKVLDGYCFFKDSKNNWERYGDNTYFSNIYEVVRDYLAEKILLED